MAEALGEIELEDNVLVIRRTHLRLTFKAEEAHPEAASRPSIPHFVDNLSFPLNDPAHTDNSPARGVSSNVCTRLLFFQI